MFKKKNENCTFFEKNPEAFQKKYNTTELNENLNDTVYFKVIIFLKKIVIMHL